jgi:hypothetical protein
MIFLCPYATVRAHSFGSGRGRRPDGAGRGTCRTERTLPCGAWRAVASLAKGLPQVHDGEPNLPRAKPRVELGTDSPPSSPGPQTRLSCSSARSGADQVRAARLREAAHAQPDGRSGGPRGRSVAAHQPRRVRCPRHCYDRLQSEYQGAAISLSPRSNRSVHYRTRLCLSYPATFGRDR